MLFSLSSINLNRTTFSIMILLVSPLLSACQFKPVTDQNNGVVPQVVHDMAGTYVGSWTMFGIDAEGQVVEYSSWTDTVKAENPQMDGDRAYVLATDEMVFENSNIPPMEVSWKEGYISDAGWHSWRPVH